MMLTLQRTPYRMLVAHVKENRGTRHIPCNSISFQVSRRCRRQSTQQYRCSRYHGSGPARSTHAHTGSSTASTRSNVDLMVAIIGSLDAATVLALKAFVPNRLVKHSGRVIPKVRRRADLPCAASIMRASQSPKTEKLLCLIRWVFSLASNEATPVSGRVRLQ